ncbi:hypothetical protein QQ045_007190 [Rhodiola kirilowii]
MLLWKSEVDLNICNYSDYHIDAVIKGEDSFRVTLFYGNPETHRRGESWELIRSLNRLMNEPWLIFGDFNEVLFGWEIKGRRVRGEWQMKKFRDVLQECNLSDIGFRGAQFTYSNKRKGVWETKARLDRAFATFEWRQRFPTAEVWHEVSGCSDHSPLIIRWKERRKRSRLGLFRFEPMWLRHNGYEEAVRDLWEGNAGNTHKLTDCLKRCADGLKDWNKKCFGKVKNKIKELQEELSKVQDMERTDDSADLEVNLTSELDEWFLREELLWKQRSRIDWLKEGDRNTRYFHQRASHRRRMNRIEKLQTNDGMWVTEEEEICGAFAQYYKEIFKSSRGGTRVRWPEWMGFIPEKLNDEMRNDLMRPFSEAEIREAIFQMCPTKAPGLDGFSALFYQKHWSMIKGNVSRQILRMLNNGALEEGINKTLITLIPKVKEPKTVAEFRPISLCNVGIKIVTKMMANRLKPILPAIISENQGAFVPGKIISDNIIAAQELLHYIHTRGRQKMGYFALKLDISKAYDRVEWDFLEVLMQRLGFPEEWNSKVMSCVKTVSYVVRVNDFVTEEIKPARGIRQGDPLSPFLFLICSEWLNLKVKEYQRRRKLKGVKISKDGPEITHMLFADDSMFFLQATPENASNLKRILEDYEKLSGQKINLDKSEIFFGRNVAENVKRTISASLGVKQVETLSKYLGLPIAFGNNRTEMFKDIIGRVWKKMQGWKEKSLSIGGKEVLIKSIVQAMPTYTMSCFKIPDSLIKRIVSMISNFWWSNSKDGRGIHWCNYRKLCRDKMEGGVGFKELSTFNDALLAKQIWRLMEKPESMCSKLLKGKYYKDTTPLSCHMRNRPSLVWRNIWTAGQKVKQWIQPSDNGEEIRWTREPDGKFTAKSAYKALKEISDKEEANRNGEQADKRRTTLFWKIIWKMNTQPKVRLFAWRLFHDFLPSATNLTRRGMEGIRRCPVCGLTGETTMHTILYCWWAQTFWKKLSVDCSFLAYNFQDPADWLWYCVYHHDKTDVSTFLQGARLIWLNRNSLLHGKNGQSPFSAARYVMHQHWRLQSGEEKFVVTDLSGGARWSKPNKGVVKINVDGAWKGTTKEAGVGISCRDEWGRVCFVEAYSIDRAKSSLEVEQAALARALKIAEEENLQKVTFETDNAQVMNGLMQGDGGDGQSSELLCWCKDRLGKNPEWNLSLIPREANVCADLLAKKALGGRWSWRNHLAIPLCISLALF